MSALTRFLKDEDLEGMWLCENHGFIYIVRALKKEISKLCCINTVDFLGDIPVPLVGFQNGKLINYSITVPYVFIPKPIGTRCLIYVDKIGDITLGNETRIFFTKPRSRSPADTQRDNLGWRHREEACA